MKTFTSSMLKAGGMMMLLTAAQTAFAVDITGTYYLYSADFATPNASAYDNEYQNKVEITIARPLTSVNWDLVVTNLCGQGTVYGGTLSSDEKTLTLTNLGYAYFSDRDYSGKGVESLGGADGSIMGDLTMTLKDDGSLALSDFTVINTKLSGSDMTTSTLATYKSCVATPVKEYFFSTSEEDFSTSTSKSEPSVHDNVYSRYWGFKVRKFVENESYDVEVSGMGGVSTCKAYGSLDNDGTIKLNMLGTAYLSAYQGYSGTGTESLADAGGSIFGSSITLTPQADDSYSFTDFTAVNTTLSNGLNCEVLATWKNGKATPQKKYHFVPESFTKGADSPHGNTYPEEFDFSVRKCIENSNYDVVVTGLCGREGVMSYGEESSDGSITLAMLGGTYLSPYQGYSGIGTESLGTAAGSFMGSITFKAQTDGTLKADDFTAINTQLDGGLNMTVLARWTSGTAIPYGSTTALGVSTAINNTRTDSALKVRTGNGCIYFDDVVNCDVYTLSGALIRSEKSNIISGLQSGLYIVRVNGKAIKVIL